MSSTVSAGFFGRLIHDFLKALLARYPHSMRVVLTLRRFPCLLRAATSKHLFETFAHYFDSLDAETPGIMSQEFTESFIRIVNSKQSLNTFLTKIRLDRMFVTTIDEPTKRAIWDRLQKLASGVAIIRKYARFFSLLDAMLDGVDFATMRGQTFEQVRQSILLRVSNHGGELLEEFKRIAEGSEADFTRILSAITQATEMAINSSVQSVEKVDSGAVDFIAWTGKPRIFVDVDACCICFEAQPNARIGGCMHDSFCSPCLYNYVVDDKNRCCPLCRHRITTVYVEKAEAE